MLQEYVSHQTSKHTVEPENETDFVANSKENKKEKKNRKESKKVMCWSGNKSGHTCKLTAMCGSASQTVMVVVIVTAPIIPWSPCSRRKILRWT